MGGETAPLNSNNAKNERTARGRALVRRPRQGPRRGVGLLGRVAERGWSVEQLGASVFWRPRGAGGASWRAGARGFGSGSRHVWRGPARSRGSRASGSARLCGVRACRALLLAASRGVQGAWRLHGEESRERREEDGGREREVGWRWPAGRLGRATAWEN
jgi:hypothetical protein